MTLKKFKRRTKRKTILELQRQEQNLLDTLKLALRIYIEAETPANEEDLKYIRQLGRKIKITQNIISTKLEE